MVTPLITNDAEERLAAIESELRRLKEENRKLKSRWDLLDTYFPLVHVDGIEIGRDFFRGEQGFLQFATGTGAERAVLYFVTTLDTDPGSVDPRGEIVGSASSNGLSLFLRSRKSSTQSVEVELDSDVANYPALKVNVAGASSTAAGFAVYSEFQTVDFDLAGDNIKLPVGSSDSTFTGLGDGLLNYRSDLDVVRLRANGAWVTLIASDNASWTDLTDGGETTLHTHAGGGMLKTASGGYFLIPAGPSGGVSINSSASADTYGSWTEMISSTAAAIYIVGMKIADLSNTAKTYVQVDIGTGAAASETSVGEWIFTRVDFGTDAGQGGATVTFPFPIPVATSTRVACRVADSVASALASEVSLICINQADLTEI